MADIARETNERGSGIGKCDPATDGAAAMHVIDCQGGYAGWDRPIEVRALTAAGEAPVASTAARIMLATRRPPWIPSKLFQLASKVALCDVVAVTVISRAPVVRLTSDLCFL